MNSAVLKTFGWLLWRDVLVLKGKLFNRVLDACIWSATNILISNYILPSFGITSKYGLMIWVGTIVTMAFFEGAYIAQDLVADREGNYYLGYQLTLPLPSWLVIVKLGCGAALNCGALSILMAPFGALLLGRSLDLSNFNFIKYMLFFILLNLACGFFGIVLFGVAKSMATFSEVWRRIANPLWAFGGYQFTWGILYNSFPRLALFTLLNPVTYMFEGLRSALLGSQGFIPLWFSSIMLAIFTAVFALLAMRRCKKMLDYV